eukprot:gene16424-biopygen8865
MQTNRIQGGTAGGITSGMADNPVQFSSVSFSQSVAASDSVRLDPVQLQSFSFPAWRHGGAVAAQWRHSMAAWRHSGGKDASGGMAAQSGGTAAKTG